VDIKIVFFLKTHMVAGQHSAGSQPISKDGD